MLGFDAYTKSIIGTIVDQRISLFLVKQGVLSYPLIEKQSGNEASMDFVIERLFTQFVTSLKDGSSPASLYEEYAFASIFIQDPNYDFLAADAAASIEKAHASLKAQFKVRARLLFKGQTAKSTPAQPLDQSSDSVFAFLQQPQFQREIPSYLPTNVSYECEPGKKCYEHLQETFLHPEEGQGIENIPGPFYVEYFYRLKPSVALPAKLTDGSPAYSWAGAAQRSYYKYFSKHDRIVMRKDPNPGGGTPIFPPADFVVGDPGWPAQSPENFDRGIRLMFNMTPQLRTAWPAAEDDPWSPWWWLVPTYKLPFATATTLPATIPPKLAQGTYNLPFLSPDWLGGAANWVAAVPNLLAANAKAMRGFGRANWLLGGRSWTSCRGSSSPVATGKCKTAKNNTGLYYEALSNASFPTDAKGKIHLHKQSLYLTLGARFDNPQRGGVNLPLKMSKSQISAEGPSRPVRESMFNAGHPWPPKTGYDNHPIRLYWPLIVGEYVDTSSTGAELTNTQLLDKLLQTPSIKYLESLVEKGTADQTAATLLLDKQLNINLKNIDSLSSLKIKGYPISPFNTQLEEKGLDNMLLNLINFDEEK